MAWRESIYSKGVVKSGHIPTGSRVGNIVWSSIIFGRDPATGKLATSVEGQIAHAFGLIRETVEIAGGSTEDIVKLTVWLTDKKHREIVNEHWVAMFPDKASRPARTTLTSELDDGCFIQCEFMAVLKDAPR